MKLKNTWGLLILLVLAVVIVPLVVFMPRSAPGKKDPWASVDLRRPHLDHAAFFNRPFERPQDVTLACLDCHKEAAKDLMKTAHWQWEGNEVLVPGHDKPMKIGKKNLINNFCIGIRGNWASCASCHAGYGWEDANFDFDQQENVDCLICHDWTGTYAKGAKGLPLESVDLLTVAKGVGYPKRDNCGICHVYGGGGEGVKHGDLDQTLVYASPDADVHMGRYNLLCIDCHKTEKHNISGKAYSVSIDHTNGIACTQCHAEKPHDDERINGHISSVACETCHIPYFARRAPTKTTWDWSKAGDPSRHEDVHEYLKIKGEFEYEQKVVPEYHWFNLKTGRDIMGDRVDPGETTHLNPPLGDIHDDTARIWPFKVHRAKQPYDTIHQVLLQPVTSGAGGYWHEFDWDKALRLGAGTTGVDYSGSYGFINTDMHWPLSHMVVSRNEALKCQDCHGANSRMNWKDLGYREDPARNGGRDNPENVSGGR